MNRTTTLAVLAAALLASSPLLAQDAQERPVPPETALKASEIIARIESRPDFRYLDEVGWDEQGYYEIIYFTNDKARVEIKINPVTGEPV